MSAARAGSCSQTLLGGARLLATYRLPASPNPSSSPPEPPYKAGASFALRWSSVREPECNWKAGVPLDPQNWEFLSAPEPLFFCSFVLQRVCRGPEEGNSDTKITEIDLFQMVLQAPVLNYCLPRFTPSRVATKLRGIPLPAHYLPRTNKQSQAEMRGGVGKPEEPSFVVQGLWGCGRGRGQAAY